jgi:hypothetical protein
MAYSTINWMRSILPKVITIGTEDTKITTPTLQPQGGTTTITPQDAQRYLEMANENIDGRLRPIYYCPLKRYKVFEAVPIQNIKAGDTSVRVPDNGRFVASMWLRITSSAGTELHVIKSIPEDNVYEVQLQEKVQYNHPLSSQPLVSQLKYPDPIMSMCAKYAVSLLIDRQFVAEQEPDVSNYGKTLRSQYASDMDSVLQGVIRLEGQTIMGRRFVRIPLYDKWSTTAEFQMGGQKET